jgi:hypothetical protein
VVVWLNGAFGVGKTSVARLLVKRLRGSMLVDPERLGFVLQRLPGRLPGDFQDMAAWRRGTVHTVRLAARLRRHVVVPMTVVKPTTFDAIIGTLRSREDVRHFALLASPETIRARLRARGSSGWAVEQIERCTTALAAPAFARHVVTDGRTVEEIAGEIVEAVT